MENISKSEFLLFLHSPRMFYDLKKNPSHLPPKDDFDDALKAQSETVKSYAMQVFPDGEMCEMPDASKETVLAVSDAALQSGKTAYEVTVEHKGLSARADIVTPDGRGGMEIIIVRSGTDVEEENFYDAAFQLNLFRNAGYLISAVKIMHLDKEYVQDGDIKLVGEGQPGQGVFLVVDATQKAEMIIDTKLDEKISEARSVLASDKPPAITIADSSMEKLSKEELFHYRPDLAGSDSLFRLPGGRRTSILKIARRSNTIHGRDIDAPVSVVEADLGDKPSKKAKVFRDAAKTNTTQIDKEAIRTMMESIAHPCVLLDFETYLQSVPLDQNAKPNSHRPFLVCGIRKDSPNSPEKMTTFTVHPDEMLAGDGMLLMARRVSALLKNAKTICAYNATFEKMCLKTIASSAGLDKKDAEILISACDQFVDLGKPFMGFDYYNPKQKGSASIKKITEVFFADDPYTTLDVSNGGQATALYAMMIGGRIPREKWDGLISAMEKYCVADVENMRDVAGVIEVVAGSENQNFANDVARTINPGIVENIGELPKSKVAQGHATKIDVGTILVSIIKSDFIHRANSEIVMQDSINQLNTN